jgi:hypothetical protein
MRSGADLMVDLAGVTDKEPGCRMHASLNPEIITNPTKRLVSAAQN